MTLMGVPWLMRVHESTVKNDNFERFGGVGLVTKDSNQWERLRKPMSVLRDFFLTFPSTPQHKTPKYHLAYIRAYAYSNGICPPPARAQSVERCGQCA